MRVQIAVDSLETIEFTDLDCPDPVTAMREVAALGYSPMIGAMHPIDPVILVMVESFKKLEKPRKPEIIGALVHIGSAASMRKQLKDVIEKARRPRGESTN